MPEKSRSNDTLVCVLTILFVLLSVGGGVGWHWYQAGVQADVYRRQGVEMSRWECFVGSKPIERTVTIKDAK